jgi:hypothetical protein
MAGTSAGDDENIDFLRNMIIFLLAMPRSEFTRGEVERPEAPLLPHAWRSGSASPAFPAEFADSVKSVSQTLWRLPALHFLLRKTRRNGEPGAVKASHRAAERWLFEILGWMQAGTSCPCRRREGRGWRLMKFANSKGAVTRTEFLTAITKA